MIYIQAKRGIDGSAAPRSEVRWGATGTPRTQGCLHHTSAFTREALEYAGKIEAAQILIDGERLAKLMVEHGVGALRLERIRSSVDSDYFSRE